MPMRAKHLLLATRVMSTLTYCGLPSVVRQRVSTDMRDWKVSFAGYDPPGYQMDFTGKEWADPDIGEHHFKFNQMDGNIDRTSHSGQYAVVDGFPLNPTGRTGLRLRGILGRWGPNHAADPIVTRWKRDPDTGQIVRSDATGRPVLQFVAIRRRDTKEWALPGGMVDSGEQVSQTVRREFMEEALNSLRTPDKNKELSARMEQLFSKGEEVYKGVVDDRRNTDNAWMETTCYLFHDETGQAFGEVTLEAGDDAEGVQWTDASGSLVLYANHKEFIERCVHKLGAHWL